MLNPIDPKRENRDGTEEVWKDIVTDGVGFDWSEKPAVARRSISTPTTLRLFHSLNAGKSYGDQVKPFNFLNAAFVHPIERPADDERIVLVAPYEKGRDRLERQDWINRFNERSYRITTEPSGGRVRPGLVTVKTYGDTMAEYASHPEPKSLGPDGKPCDRTTIGLLGRRPVSATIVRHIGKESNRLEEAQPGLLDDTDEPLNRYDQHDLVVFRELAVPILPHLGIRETARRTGLGLGSVSAALSDQSDRRSTPRAPAVLRYLAVASEHASDLLNAAAVRPAMDHEPSLKQALSLTD